MSLLSFATFDALVLAALFAASAAVHLAGPEFVRRAYARWGFHGKFYRVAGSLHLLVALFLSNPFTRIWGVALGAMIAFGAVVILLSHGRYRTSVGGMLILVALVPAVLAGAI